MRYDTGDNPAKVEFIVSREAIELLEHASPPFDVLRRATSNHRGVSVLADNSVHFLSEATVDLLLDYLSATRLRGNDIDADVNFRNLACFVPRRIFRLVVPGAYLNSYGDWGFAVAPRSADPVSLREMVQDHVQVCVEFHRTPAIGIHERLAAG